MTMVWSYDNGAIVIPSIIQLDVYSDIHKVIIHNLLAHINHKVSHYFLLLGRYLGSCCESGAFVGVAIRANSSNQFWFMPNAEGRHPTGNLATTNLFWYCLQG